MQNNNKTESVSRAAPPKADKTYSERLSGMLGLAARARNIVCGTDLSCDSVRAGKARLVLVASDASANTKKRITNCCTYYECECAVIPLTTNGLGKSVGKKGAVGTVALTDANFTKGIKKILCATESKAEKAQNVLRRCDIC